jgi:adenine C2-methylase RlmN of 23S rRNA A2503 and tRNA A37
MTNLPRALREHLAAVDGHVRLTRGREIDAACGQLAVRSETPAALSTPA